MRYFAHSAAETSEEQWQLLVEHLSNAGEIASIFASVFGCADAGKTVGLLHDLGKYTQKFQARLRGSTQRVDHSTHGACVARQRFGAMGQLLAYAIAGHHAGLANGAAAGERTTLIDRLDATDLPALDPVWEQEIALPDNLGPPKDFALCDGTLQQQKDRYGFQLAFLVRMLFSCLVDADFLDTERFYSSIEQKPNAKLRTAPIHRCLNCAKSWTGTWPNSSPRATSTGCARRSWATCAHRLR